jgi:hypothetical protein
VGTLTPFDGQRGFHEIPLPMQYRMQYKHVATQYRVSPVALLQATGSVVYITDACHDLRWIQGPHMPEEYASRGGMTGMRSEHALVMPWEMEDGED